MYNERKGMRKTEDNLLDIIWKHCYYYAKTYFYYYNEETRTYYLLTSSKIGEENNILVSHTDFKKFFDLVRKFIEKETKENEN